MGYERLEPDRAGPADRRRATGSRPGFTLIEMLMVLAIIAIVTAVTVPSLVRSIRGNRLRAASRTVVQMGRYARSMAVLHQQEMVLAFDLGSAQVSARPGGTTEATAAGARESETDAGPDEPLAPAELEPALSEPEEPGATAAAPGTGLSGMEPITRRLDQVAIESVAVGEDEKERTTAREGISVVVYASNGRCRPYTVLLRDQFGSAVRIDVDALASAQTEATETGGVEP